MPLKLSAHILRASLQDFLFISGQIPLDPKTMDIVSSDFDNQVNHDFVITEIIEKNQQTLITQ